MNWTQKRILAGGILLFTVSLLFPPWQSTYQRPGTSRVERPLGYSIIFSPPTNNNRLLGLRIDTTRLVFQLLAIFATTGMFYILFKDTVHTHPKTYNDKPDDQTTSVKNCNNDLYSYSGGDGRSEETAIRIAIPQDIDILRNKFAKILKDKIPAKYQNDTNKLDGSIAEMIKIKYLESRFGKRDEKWRCGDRFYISPSKQSQEIIFNDNRRITLFFDFIEFYPDGVW